MDVLITGGAGFIGSHLTEFLLDQGHHVHNIDNFNDYYDPLIKENNIARAKTHPNYRLFRVDILDTEALVSVFRNNHYVQGTIQLLELCNDFDIKKFVFASSSSVYGANQKVPFSETDPVDHPISPYAATKKAGELVCYTYSRLYDISINCLRFFTVYGPRQRQDMAIHKFTRLIDAGKPIPVFGAGDSRRDYTFIDDILQGIWAAMNYWDGYHIYNLGESQTIALCDLIALIEEAMGKNAVLEYREEQQGDVPITFADMTRAKADLGYSPTTPIQQGIKKFVHWYLANKK